MIAPRVVKKKYPIQYPATPPITELTVQINAYVQAFTRLAIIIGISMMSGGIGKKELSVKAIKARNHGAFG